MSLLEQLIFRGLIIRLELRRYFLSQTQSEELSNNAPFEHSINPPQNMNLHNSLSLISFNNAFSNIDEVQINSQQGNEELNFFEFQDAFKNSL